MADTKTTEYDHPLTIVGTDADGSEVYRTQMPWNGTPCDLSEVPSRDLDDRRPTWAKVQVFNAKGEEILARSNDDAGSAEQAREDRTERYANDKDPVSPTDVRNDKPEELALSQTDQKAADKEPAKGSEAKGKAAEKDAKDSSAKK